MLHFILQTAVRKDQLGTSDGLKKWEEDLAAHHVVFVRVGGDGRWAVAHLETFRQKHVHIVAESSPILGEQHMVTSSRQPVPRY